ncbi:hypothetical protein ACIBQX_34780 [Nonomuraea sp. NPDC049714]|uniref:hypothetical protein n=1 Tax=Nonomuraea sp. NPDC049714 TaxID=3364357 RepID=UPI0037A6F64B
MIGIACPPTQAIISHELIWEITEQLIARGACTRVPQGEDLTGLLFLLTSEVDLVQ